MVYSIAMSLVMNIKNVLRRSGYDAVRYHPFWETFVAPLGIKNILDIGANVGMFAQDVRSRFPNATVYAFEPLPYCYTKLLETMRGDANFHSWNVALGSAPGTVTMDQSSFHPSSSIRSMSALHKELYPKSAELTSVSVEVARLDDLMRTVDLTGPTLIKMDVQGYEDEVIKGGKETIRRASILIIETSFVPLYEGQPLFDDIYRSVQELGFSYRGRRETHYSRITDLPIYEDAVFIRDDLDAKGVTS